MEPSKKSFTKVWQVCRCEVVDHRDYCVTCFSSKSQHMLEAMKDEDTFLRFGDLQIQCIRNKKVLEYGIKS
jgi:hypothetical protein